LDNIIQPIIKSNKNEGRRSSIGPEEDPGEEALGTFTEESSDRGRIQGE
jgi:hypothetical protein